MKVTNQLSKTSILQWKAKINAAVGSKDNIRVSHLSMNPSLQPFPQQIHNQAQYLLLRWFPTL